MGRCHVFSFRHVVELAEPAQRAQAGSEAVLAAAGDDERRQFLQAAADRPLRDREAARSVVRPDEGVLLGRGADEDAVVQPLGLDELELALQVRAGEHEDDSAVLAVVLEHPLGQHRPVARAPPNHPVQAHVDAAFVIERIARIRAPGVRAGRALEATRIVAVEEVVVALRVGAELGIVALRGERQRRPALPASDHLRAEQRLLLAGRCLRVQVLPVGRDAGVQLAEHDVGAVAAEHLGCRHRRQLARLVGVAEDDLAGLDRPLLRVGWRNPAAFDRRLTDAVLETERGASGRELVAVLTPDHLDARQLLVRLPRPLGERLQLDGVGRKHR